MADRGRRRADSDRSFRKEGFMAATDHEPFFSIFFFIICRLRFKQIAGTFVPPFSKNCFVFKEIKAGEGLCRFFL